MLLYPQLLLFSLLLWIGHRLSIQAHGLRALFPGGGTILGVLWKLEEAGPSYRMQATILSPGSIHKEVRTSPCHMPLIHGPSDTVQQNRS